jgi:ubiquinone/menaquinone biosynthesis C-methylase UbiE
MLEFAANALTTEHVSFQPVDAQKLPFSDRTFDLVLCQFGIMFFPDKVRANQEAGRVPFPNDFTLVNVQVRECVYLRAYVCNQLRVCDVFHLFLFCLDFSRGLPPQDGLVLQVQNR